MSRDILDTTADKIQQVESRPSHIRLGMVFFILSEVFLFSALFWAYYQLRAETTFWPPAGVELDITLAVINTGVLLLSSVTLWQGGKAIEKGKRRGLAFGLALTMILASIFLGITIYEWLNETFRPWSHAYGSVFYTLTGFHALHVFAGLMILLALFIRTLRGLFSAQNYRAIEVGSLYWHFVDFVWILVFTSIFIVR